MELVRIAGFDPGLRFCGFAVVNYEAEKNEIWVSNAGILKTPVAYKGLDALLYMIDEIKRIAERPCFHECDHIVIEMPAAIYSKSFSAGAIMPVAGVAGAAMSIFEKEKIIPAYPSTWNEAKRKEKTRKITEELLGSYEDWLYDDAPKAASQFEHIIDAASMALWAMRKNYLEE